MKSKARDRDPSSTPGRESSAQGAAASEEDIESVLHEFRRLVQVAGDTGRDWKLIDALLRTMIELVVQTQGDLFESEGTRDDEPSANAESTVFPDETTVGPRLRLRPKYRLRLEAVIDSWSDDETADFLGIGLRQVRQRAQQGTLFHFEVNKKRRYPVWQFDQFCGVLDGVKELGRAVPDSWETERVYAFMTTRSPALNLLTPAQWLLMKLNPDSIVEAIEEVAVG